MTTATLFISQERAADAARRYLAKVMGGAFKVFPRVRRDPDTREVERGFVCQVEGATGHLIFL